MRDARPARGLRREGMAVDVAYDGTDALERTAVTEYDVVVLDRDLPGVHGDQVCRTLVARDVLTRVLMLTETDGRTRCCVRSSISMLRNVISV